MEPHEIGSIPHSPPGDSFSREYSKKEEEPEKPFNKITDSPIKSAYIERLLKDMEDEKKEKETQENSQKKPFLRKGSRAKSPVKGIPKKAEPNHRYEEKK